MSLVISYEFERKGKRYGNSVEVDLSSYRLPFELMADNLQETLATLECEDEGHRWREDFEEAHARNPKKYPRVCERCKFVEKHR